MLTYKTASFIRTQR